jgi:hypothetical protein
MTMRELQIPLPELGLIAGTRALAGFGLGLLLAEFFSEEQRKSLGWTFLLLGGLSTIPLAVDVLGRRLPAARA